MLFLDLRKSQFQGFLLIIALVFSSLFIAKTSFYFFAVRINKFLAGGIPPAAGPEFL